ncbi:MAG: ATP-binding protein [Candidatus Thorarchaeota archaeon]
MIDESILNLQITILLMLGTLIFIFVSFKRKDLIIYLPTYLIIPIGYLFIYLQIFEYSFRLLGNSLFLIGILFFIFAVYFEYFKIIKSKNYSIKSNPRRNNILLILSPITSLIIGIQVIFTILLSIAIYMLIKLYLLKRNTKYASLLVYFSAGLISAISTVLSNFPIIGAWEFSYVAMIILSAIYFIFPIMIYLEEKLYTVGVKLVESEAKYQLITENANDLIALLNKNYDHEYINERAYFEILGYDKTDLIGKKIWELVHSDDLKHIIDTRGVSTESFQDTAGVDKEEIRIRHKDGHYIWVDYTSKVFLDNQGEVKIIVISRDITERRKAEDLIKEENQRLLELDTLRKDLINRISHELKTPLTSIYGAAQILIKANKNDEIKQIYPYLEMSYRQSIRLKELIESLLDTSRVDNHKLELRLSDENISLIIDSCIKDLHYLAGRREQILEVTLPDEVFLKVDKHRIEQVLVNIISNAIKNTPSKGKIYVYLEDNEIFIDIIIKDTGVGITQDEKKLLFQKFGKIERYGMNLDVDIEGVGLGLYISKEIAKLHGGEIIIQSEGRNKGTTVTIRLYKKQIRDDTKV